MQAQWKNLALLIAATAFTPARVDLVLFGGIRDLPHFNPDIEASALPERVGGEPIPIGPAFERHVRPLVNDLIHSVKRENVSDPPRL